METFKESQDSISSEAKALAARIFAQMQEMQEKGNLHEESASWEALQKNLKKLSTYIDAEGNQIAIPEMELRSLFSLATVKTTSERDVPAEMARIAAKALENALGFPDSTEE